MTGACTLSLMYVVIFRAHARDLGGDYGARAQGLRERAITEFGCIRFVSACEGDLEIALSYWPDEESIRRWRADLDHRGAQEAGRHTYYRDYDIEVAKVERAYGWPGDR
ncbi:MAG: antibiotic biosynthesis monooxygenase [Polyangiaceae bacterium]